MPYGGHGGAAASRQSLCGKADGGFLGVQRLRQNLGPGAGGRAGRPGNAHRPDQYPERGQGARRPGFLYDRAVRQGRPIAHLCEPRGVRMQRQPLERYRPAARGRKGGTGGYCLRVGGFRPGRGGRGPGHHLLRHERRDRVLLPPHGDRRENLHLGRAGAEQLRRVGGFSGRLPAGRAFRIGSGQHHPHRGHRSAPVRKAA